MWSIFRRTNNSLYLTASVSRSYNVSYTRIKSLYTLFAYVTISTLIFFALIQNMIDILVSFSVDALFSAWLSLVEVRRYQISCKDVSLSDYNYYFSLFISRHWLQNKNNNIYFENCPSIQFLSICSCYSCIFPWSPLPFLSLYLYLSLPNALFSTLCNMIFQALYHSNNSILRF